MSEREADPLKRNVEELRAALEAGESIDTLAAEAGVDRATALRFAAGGRQRITTIVRMHLWASARRAKRGEP